MKGKTRRLLAIAAKDPNGADVSAEQAAQIHEARREIERRRETNPRDSRLGKCRMAQRDAQRSATHEKPPIAPINHDERPMALHPANDPKRKSARLAPANDSTPENARPATRSADCSGHTKSTKREQPTPSTQRASPHDPDRSAIPKSTETDRAAHTAHARGIAPPAPAAPTTRIRTKKKTAGTTPRSAKAGTGSANTGATGRKTTSKKAAQRSAPTATKKKTTTLTKKKSTASRKKTASA